MLSALVLRKGVWGVVWCGVSGWSKGVEWSE